MKALLVSILLCRMSPIVYSKQEVRDYEELISQLKNNNILHYSLPYPKSRFLNYLALTGLYVFHGSNHKKIDRFEPRQQTLFNNEVTKAVFASADPNWSIFYAVLDRTKIVGSFRNGCVSSNGKRYHYYSLNASTQKNNPWTDGMLYILPKHSFERADQGKTYFDEWISHEPVAPIAKLSVSIEDFYFKDKVATHKDNESLVKTWLLYKARLLLSRLGLTK